MTGVWATPVPLYLQGRGGSQAPAADGHDNGDPLAGTQRLGASPHANDVLAQSGARAPMRRHSLGSVPTAQKVSEANEKWLDYAPTSPQRRKSFVSEPSAVSGNPFEIYKEPDTNNDRLTPNTFYEAGSSYTVNEKPLVMSDESDWTTQPTVQQSVTPATAAPPAQPKPTAAVAPSSARPSSLGLSSSSATPPRGTPTPKASNPFLDYIGVPLSPVRYSKPAPKVVLTPRSSAQVVQAFAALDPFKRIDSPSSSVPLDQLQKDNPFVQQQQAQQPSGYSQHQQQQQYYAGWGQQQQFGFPQQQPRAAPAFGTTGFGGDVSTSGFSANGSTTSFGFDGFPGTSATTSAFGLPPWSPKKSTLNASTAFALGFDSPLEAAPTLSTFGSESPGSREAFENSAEMFDPVRQKSLAESAFDLDAAGFFGNGNGTQQQQAKEYVEDEEDEEEPPADDEGTEDESVGDGTAQFEVQEDQFSDDVDSSRRGAKYEVTFTAPTQFGMLLERKDEWTRGEVRRRERTVVTLVVDGGEAESKNVTVGSLIVSINGVDVTDKTYKETLELVKAPQRPMRVMFERENPQDEIVQGYFFVSKGPFFSVPTTMDKWRRKYVVLGGPIAKKNVLQIYDSKKAYHNTVVALFQKKGLSHRVKTYALTYSFKTSDLQERKMEGNSAPLKIFTFMTPTAKFKSIRIASESRKNVQVLFDRMRRFTGKK